MLFCHFEGKVKALRFKNSQRSIGASGCGATTGHYFTLSKDFCALK